MNSVQLIGNLTRDPELRALPSGTRVCSIRLAVNGRRRSPDGAWIEVPNFFDVIAYGPLADTCGQYLAKGRKIAVAGRLEHREWETDAGKRATVEVVAADVEFLYPRPSDVAPEPAIAAVGADEAEDIPF